ncbi:hypothetical protein [Catalinimonas niigatensis]|uniref:hypothetical protein n=1 Tax=Catalinimonas niigatensis TaxID=1397264 RepID=UPI0026671034|nr:hypothetical protein [Catalinimonas niigatensis]WPP53313.1 hypothetical protein PZB72_13115 [Catalinimonas niigatensis]
MNILFRVDAGGKVGLGHYYRSITLAKRLKSKGCSLTILHRPSLFWSKISLPFPSIVLEEEENEHVLRLIKENEYSVFYVDGILDFEESLMNEIGKRKTSVVFYQNLSSTKHLCDVFILPSLNYDERFFDSFSIHTRIFKGLDYVIFNEMVYNLPKLGKIREKVKSIGLISGGSDPKNVLLHLYSLINHQAFEDVQFTYFYGEDFMHIDKVPASPEMNASFVSYDLEQICKMDVVIGTFGVSTYELMYLGMPIISVGHQTSNAEASYRTAKHTKAVIDLGLVDALSSVELNKAIQELISNFQKRESLKQNSTRAIDALGVERVADIIISLNE